MAIAGACSDRAGFEPPPPAGSVDGEEAASSESASSMPGDGTDAPSVGPSAPPNVGPVASATLSSSGSPSGNAAELPSGTASPAIPSPSLVSPSLSTQPSDTGAPALTTSAPASSSVPNGPATPVPTSSGTETTPVPGVPLKVQGQACGAGSECQLGFCVDGVCCNGPCDAVCSTCNAEGSVGMCSGVLSDSACGTLSCPEDTACRKYIAGDLGQNCAMQGQCSSMPDCTPMNVAQGTSCGADMAACDGDGECVVPDKLMLGDECAQDSECGSAHCVDGVCCDSACDGLCEACGEAGHCDVVPEDDSDCSTLTCQSDEACKDYPDPRTSKRCQARGQCLTQQAYCVAKNLEQGTECGTGMACDNQGSCKSLCNNGQVYCDHACITPASDHDFCGASGDCSGSHDGESCSDDETCVGGKCKQWSDTEVVATGASYTTYLTQVAMTAQGNAMVIWNAKPDSDSGWQVWGKLWKRSAGTWDEATRIDSGDGDSSPTGVQALGEDFLVSWAQYNSDSGQSDLWTRRFSSQNSSWVAPIALENDSGYVQSGTLAAAGDKAAISFLQEGSADGMMALWVRIWDSGNKTWGTAFAVEKEVPDGDLKGLMAGPNSLAVSSNGDVFAAWNRRPQDSNDNRAAIAFGRRYNSGSHQWEDAKNLGTGNVRAMGYLMSVTGNGDVVGIWDGKFTGVMWSAGAKQWQQLQESDSASGICSLQNSAGDAVLGSGGGASGFTGVNYKGSDHSLGSVSQLLGTSSGASAPIVGCAPNLGFVGWANTDGHISTWDNVGQHWRHQAVMGGAPNSIAASSDGLAIVAGTNSDYDDVEVAFYE
ncbi:MAG TPA: hypothetical protein VHM70_31770 [Polyangiaceae bacterium]|nr:hypothetical protein [Polyangiaceae bacterium]